MKIYCGSRANGKTMKAIQLSVEKQMPIICLNYYHKQYIEHRAYEVGVKDKMPEPILALEARRKVIGNRKGLIVDDLDYILRAIFNDNVYYATMVYCEVEKLGKE